VKDKLPLTVSHLIKLRKGLEFKLACALGPANYECRLYCGFEDAIEVFDLTRPGEGTRLMTTPSKKSKDGLKGTCTCVITFPSPA
jgi:hypothetical protein